MSHLETKPTKDNFYTGNIRTVSAAGNMRDIIFFYLYPDPDPTLNFFQTEAERRRREAGVQQSIETGLGSCTYVCIYVCMHDFRKYLVI